MKFAIGTLSPAQRTHRGGVRASVDTYRQEPVGRSVTPFAILGLPDIALLEDLTSRSYLAVCGQQPMRTRSNKRPQNLRRRLGTVRMRPQKAESSTSMFMPGCPINL